MDLFKFDNIITNSKLPELYSHSNNLLMDIKNCSSSVIYHASTISLALMNPEKPQSKIKIHESMMHIESLTGQYKTLAEQRKLISKRIEELKPVYVTSIN